VLDNGSSPHLLYYNKSHSGRGQDPAVAVEVCNLLYVLLGVDPFPF
jgi:hypothetical protein